MVTTQYPHRLYVLKGGVAVQNSLGDWESTSPEWTYAGPCREETSGRGQAHVSTDYQDLVPTAVIQCPKGCMHIEEGATIVVSKDALDPGATRDEINELQKSGSVRVIGTCRKFDDTTFHCRIWL